MMERLMGSPIPVPLSLVVKNALKICSACSGGNPTPRIGRAETQKTRFNLTQLVKEALSEVREGTEGRNIAWNIGTLPDFYGDRSMLRLVLVNLLSNAIKYTVSRSL
jgi:signal transduction histidine kinase